MKRVVWAVLLVLLSLDVCALTMTKADFGAVTPGDRVVRKILVGADNRNNTYDLTLEGPIAKWVQVSPASIFVPASYTGEITLVLEVPLNTETGRYQSLVVASGRDVIGAGEGSNVGFMLQVKSPFNVTVVGLGEKLLSPDVETNPAAAEQSVTVLDLNVRPSKIEPGEPVWIYAKLINSGNIPVLASVAVEVSLGDEVVESFASEIRSFAVAEDHVFTFFWEDTADLEPGVYQVTAVGRADGMTSKFGPMKLTVVGEPGTGAQQAQATSSQSTYIWGIIAIVILLLLIVLVLLLKDHAAIKRLLDRRK
jgi:hypothetical protein